MSVLRESREAAGLSQRALSSKLKRSINFVNLVERGQRTLSICEFIEYAQAIGADPAQLVKQIKGA